MASSLNYKYQLEYVLRMCIVYSIEDDACVYLYVLVGAMICSLVIFVAMPSAGHVSVKNITSARVCGHWAVSASMWRTASMLTVSTGKISHFLSTLPFSECSHHHVCTCKPGGGRPLWKVQIKAPPRCHLSQSVNLGVNVSSK
jgi:hypothetical protein